MFSVSRVHPSTIEGIKRLARSIKREQNLISARALDAAAQQAGFSNYRHAKRQLNEAHSGRESPTFRMWITAYWRDVDGSTGRETLNVAAHLAWGKELQPREVQAIRGLQKFRLDAPDHGV